MLKLISSAILGLAVASGALADTATMTKPMQAGSLHDGPLDMVAYWLPLDDGSFEVTATYRGRGASDEPMRTIMQLNDGDHVSFGMPGYKGALYSFTRTDDTVTISVDMKASRVASNEGES